MVSSPLYLKRYAPFLGVNLDTSKISQNPQEASDGKNWMYGRNNEITKRPGSKIIYSSVNDKGYRAKAQIYYDAGVLKYGDIFDYDVFCIGLIPFSYNVSHPGYFDQLIRKDKLISVMGSITNQPCFGFYEKADQFVKFEYNGSQIVQYNFEVSPIDNNFYLKIIENGTLVYTSPSLGQNNSATPVLTSALITAVDALANYFSLSTTGDVYPYYVSIGTATDIPTNPGPASSMGPFNTNSFYDAYIDTSYFVRIPHNYNYPLFGSPSKVRNFFTQQATNSTSSITPLQVTYTNIDNSLYIAGGGADTTQVGFHAILGGVAKYDGYRIKPAGLYTINSVTYSSEALVGAPIFPAGAVYKWGVTVEHTDRNGDTIESDMVLINAPHTVGAGGKDSIRLNVLPYAYSGLALGEDTQYPKAYYINTAGAGTVKNILTSAAGGQHYLLPNDEIYLPISAGVYGTRKIVSVSGTNITLDTTATTAVGDACSLNYKLNLWRTKDQGNDLFLSNSYPMFYPFLTTLDDITPEASLGRKYIYPLKNHLPPPPGKLCCEHQGLLVVADIDVWYYDYADIVNNTIPANKNTVYYSTDEHQEYFHLANSFTLPLNESEQITGLKSISGTLYIFTNKKIFYVQGILNDNFSVKILVNNIGCISQNTIVEVNGVLYFSSDNNVYALTEGSLPVPIGKQIRNLLRVKDKQNINTKGKISYYYNRACAGYLKKLNLYVLSVPAIEDTNTEDPAFDFSFGNLFNPTHSIIFVYDIDKEQWSFWKDLYISSFAAFKDELWFSTVEPPSYFARSTIRKFLSDDLNYQSYNDGSVPINFEYNSSWENLDAPGVQKLLNNLTVYSLDNKISRNYTLDVTIDKDFGYNTRNTVFRLNFPFLTAQEDAYMVYSKLDSNKTRSMRVSFRNNNMYENVSISGYEIEVVPDITTLNKK